MSGKTLDVLAMILDDLVLAVVAGAAELALYLLFPAWFLISRKYRAKVRVGWASKPRWQVALHLGFFAVMWLVYAGIIVAGAALIGAVALAG